MWDLSPLYGHSNSVQLLENELLLCLKNNSIIVRNSTSFTSHAVHKLPATAPSTSTTSSPIIATSNGIVAASTGQDNINIYNTKLSASTPIAKLSIGNEGFSSITFDPSGESLLVYSLHHLRLSIFKWNSAKLPVLHIQFPKHNHPTGCAFRPTDSQFFALVERHSSKDVIGIYNAVDWKLVRHFNLPTAASDIADLAWSPDGNYIAVWESITEYILYVYTPDGRLLSSFTPYASLTIASIPSKPVFLSRSSTLSASTTSPTTTTPAKENEKGLGKDRSTGSWNGLGIRTVKWHPKGELLAVGGWDGKIRILNKMSWTTLVELSCPTKITAASVMVWKEPLDWIERTRGKGIISFEIEPLPYAPTFVRPDVGRANPKMGVADMIWSPTGKWLACQNQSFPTSVWIYSFTSTSSSISLREEMAEESKSAMTTQPQLHSLLNFSSSIRSMVWQPYSTKLSDLGGEDDGDFISGRDTLAIATGEKSFGIWREPSLTSKGEQKGMAEGVGIPTRAEFTVSTLRYAVDGSALLLNDSDTFAVAYPVAEDEVLDAEVERTWIQED